MVQLTREACGRQKELSAKKLESALKKISKRIRTNMGKLIERAWR